MPGTYKERITSIPPTPILWKSEDSAHCHKARTEILTSLCQNVLTLNVKNWFWSSLWMSGRTHPKLQVYGEYINHVTDFRYLGSKMASAASDFKRRKVNSFECFFFFFFFFFWKFPIVNLYESEYILHHLRDPPPRRLWILGDISLRRKINAFATSCYRIMLNIKRKDHVPNTMI